MADLDPSSNVNVTFQISNYTGAPLALYDSTGIQNGKYDPLPPAILDINDSISFIASGTGSMKGVWGYYGPWFGGAGFLVKFAIIGEEMLGSSLELDYTLPFTGGNVNTEGDSGSFEVTINLGAVPRP